MVENLKKNKRKIFTGQPGYRIWSANVVASLQKELMTNGPVMDCFDMYSDLWNYASGIYVVCYQKEMQIIGF